MTSPSSPETSAALLGFERQVREEIPLAQAMDLRFVSHDAQSLTVTAPLSPNINDKGCAFGGSLASILTLAGWGLVCLELRQRGLSAGVYVADSTIRYLAPVWSEITAVARLADGESFDGFADMLAVRGRSRISVVCEVPLQDGKPAAVLIARFAAIDEARSRKATG